MENNVTLLEDQQNSTQVFEDTECKDDGFKLKQDSRVSQQTPRNVWMFLPLGCS